MPAQLPAVLTFTPNLQATLTAQGAALTGEKPKTDIQFGSNGFPSLTPKTTQAAAVPSSQTYQAQQYFSGQYTIAASATQQIDLTALTNGLGGTVDFSGGGGGVKYLLVAILSPDGGATKKVKVGPQGLTNGWQGPFQAATTNFWAEVMGRALLVDCVEAAVGYAVSGTNKILGITNHGSASLTVQVLILG